MGSSAQKEKKRWIKLLSCIGSANILGNAFWAANVFIFWSKFEEGLTFSVSEIRIKLEYMR